jgi:hypothetical protein
MSTESEDIIELGEDGSFEIPSTAAKQRTQNFSELIQPVYDSECQTKISLLSSVEPGGFKIFCNQRERKLEIIVRLTADTSVSNQYLSADVMTVELSNQKTLSIMLPQMVKPPTATSKSFEDYIVTLVELA